MLPIRRPVQERPDRSLDEPDWQRTRAALGRDLKTAMRFRGWGERAHRVVECDGDSGQLHARNQSAHRAFGLLASLEGGRSVGRTTIADEDVDGPIRLAPALPPQPGRPRVGGGPGARHGPGVAS
jgi:hypothetical protein